MKYRADVDGLRAIAVIPVVLFHAEWSSFSGGYVGVDIFFVISGYLITRIIWERISRGEFSILDFYQRRVLRIFPALFAVVAASSVAAWFLLMPGAFRDYGQSVISTAAFVSNILFWRESGYFAGPAEKKPLLHTWSLSVEEQFYIVIPVLLFLVYRFRKRPLPVLYAIALASFVASAWAAVRAPSAAFYLVPFRAWELVLGGLLALGAFPRIQRTEARSLAATVGLVMIAISVTVYDHATPFPGAAALLPCVGAALLIHTGEGSPTPAHRLLTWRPMIFIGLISYSLYLWHWPLIVFVRASSSEFGLAEQLFVIGASFALAVLSWRVVEQPFRNKRWLERRRATFAWGGAAMGVAFGCGAFVHLDAGIPGRFGISHVELAATARLGDEARAETRRQSCLFPGEGALSVEAFRTSCYDASRSNVLLLGDSHASHLVPGLKREFPDVNFIRVTAGACRPLLGVNTGHDARECAPINDFRLEVLPRELEFDTVVLSARWEREDADALEETIRHLQRLGARVLVVGPIVRYREHLPVLLLAERAPPARYRLRGTSDVDAAIHAVARRTEVSYFSLLDLVCPRGACRTRIGSVPLQWDDEHLTIEGSTWVAHELVATAGNPILLER